MGGNDKRYRYDHSYRETVQTADGRRARLRPVRPSDKRMLLDAFDRLSPTSKYGRFMAAKANLTPEELRYLTEVDGFDHFAIGAVRRRLLSRDQGMGIARFVRLHDQHDTAEPAVTVVDDCQGVRLGSILLERLVEAAWERDIRWFCVELLSENTASKRLFGTLSPQTRFQHSGAGAMVAKLPLPEPRRAFDGSAGEANRMEKLLPFLARASASTQPYVARPSEPPAS